MTDVTEDRDQPTHARPHVPGETAWWLARSDSLRFAPSVSGCHAVNVQLNW